MLLIPSVLSGVLWGAGNAINIMFSGFALNSIRKPEKIPILDGFQHFPSQELQEVKLEESSLKYSNFGSMSLSFKQKLTLFLGASTAFFGSTLAISLYMNESQKAEGIIIGSQVAATMFLSPISLAINFQELSNYFCRG